MVRIAVIGCGAVGSLFAANLGTLEDVEVWAYDPWREHVDAINANGLRLSGAGDVVGRVRATTDPGALPPCELGIVATKSQHTSEAMAATAHAFGAVCSVQNGAGQRGARRRAREGGDPRDDLPGRPRDRAGPRRLGHEGRHAHRAVRAEPGADVRRRGARRRVHARRDADARTRGRARRPVAEG